MVSLDVSSLPFQRIDRLDGGNQGGAGGQAFLDQRAAEVIGFVEVGGGGKNDAGG